ncbi:MAG: hypothetical protein GY925_10000 [Actinomycetia bacterium]|nr:hypothetical protein [Actinomycetes bacterium]
MMTRICLLRKVGGLVVGLSILAAGCSSSESPEEVQPQSYSDLDLGSPLLDSLGGAQEPEEATFEREALIYECMKRQGFDYQSIVYSDASHAFDRGDVFERSWVEEFGFGASTTFFDQDQLDGTVVGNPGTSNDPAPVLDNIPEDQRGAYFEALYGVEADSAAYGPPGGCVAEVEAEITAKSPAALLSLHLGVELADLEARIAAAPVVVEWEREVSDCMALDGFKFSTIEQVRQSFWVEVEELAASMPTGDPLLGVDVDDPEAVEEAIALANYRLDETRLASLREIQGREIDTALAAFDCGAGVIEQLTFMDPIRDEYERAFLEEHADTISLLRSEANG